MKNKLIYILDFCGEHLILKKCHLKRNHERFNKMIITTLPTTLNKSLHVNRIKEEVIAILQLPYKAPKYSL